MAFTPLRDTWLASLLVLMVATCAFAFVLWQFQLLRSTARVQPVAFENPPVLRWLTKFTLVYGLAWVCVCVYIYAGRAPLGRGFEVLMLSLQMGVLLSSLFHVDGQLKRLAWLLLFIQISCWVAVAMFSVQADRYHTEVMASVLFVLLGYAVATFRAREHAYVRSSVLEWQSVVVRCGHLSVAGNPLIGSCRLPIPQAGEGVDLGLMEHQLAAKRRARCAVFFSCCCLSRSVLPQRASMWQFKWRQHRKAAAPADR